VTRHSLLALAVFVLAAAVLLQRANEVGYNTDEGQFISTAQYFEYAFLDRAFSGPQWDETYWTLTQPPMTRYILGAAIWLSGNPVPRVNLDHRIEEARGPNRERFLDPRTFSNERRLAEERRIDRPRPAVLAAGRVPMALFGAGAVLITFLLGRVLAGPIAGLIAALGLLAAPLALTLLPRAHAEAPLIFFTLLGLYLGVRAARRSMRIDAAVGTLGIWAGLATGLAAATKLPAVLGLAALGGFAVWAFVVWRWARDDVADRVWRWSALAAVLGLATFLAVNPFMWPDPVARTAAMLRFRQQELVGQRVLNAESAVPEGLIARAGLLLERTFVTEAPIAQLVGLPIDAALAIVGAGALALRAWRARRAGGLVGAEAFVLVWVATFLAGTAPNLGLDWERYYLPTVALGLVLVGVGADTLVGAARRAIPSSRRAPSASPTAPPPITTASSGSAG
jgi:4-amino-4-deoxy-L-arabinose transferase-like glycosyltransferase